MSDKVQCTQSDNQSDFAADSASHQGFNQQALNDPIRDHIVWCF